MTTTTTTRPACPACGSKQTSNLSDPRTTGHMPYGLRACKRCYCLFTTTPIYKGDSYGLVKPGWCRCPGDQLRNSHPYDLEVLGSDGPERRHGFYHPQCRAITQVG